MKRLPKELIENYHIFIPFIKIYDFRKSIPLKPGDKTYYSFCVSIGGRFCMWNVSIEFNDELPHGFSWNPACAGGRIINGTDDAILSVAISQCIQENLKEIKYACEHFTMKEFVYDIKKAVRFAKEKKLLCDTGSALGDELQEWNGDPHQNEKYLKTNFRN
jgi:hypothetical protein